MSDTTEYQGWTNYNTWCVGLWIDNTNGSQQHWHATATQCLRLAKGGHCVDRLTQASYDLGDALKAAYEEHWEELAEGAGLAGTMWMDLMGSALEDVNWRQIAESMLDAIDRDTVLREEAEGTTSEDAD